MQNRPDSSRPIVSCGFDSVLNQSGIGLGFVLGRDIPHAVLTAFHYSNRCIQFQSTCKGTTRNVIHVDKPPYTELNTTKHFAELCLQKRLFSGNRCNESHVVLVWNQTHIFGVVVSTWSWSWTQGLGLGLDSPMTRFGLDLDSTEVVCPVEYSPGRGIRVLFVHAASLHERASKDRGRRLSLVDSRSLIVTYTYRICAVKWKSGDAQRNLQHKYHKYHKYNQNIHTVLQFLQFLQFYSFYSLFFVWEM